MIDRARRLWKEARGGVFLGGKNEKERLCVYMKKEWVVEREGGFGWGFWGGGWGEQEEGGCFEKDDVEVLQRNATQRDEVIGLRKITAKV